MGNRLRQLRKNKGLTLEQMAVALGTSAVNISRYERGERQPKLETLSKIANYFGVSVPYLLEYDDNPGNSLTIADLNSEELEAYDRIDKMLTEEYPQQGFSWSKIGQLLINCDITEE